jgi:hypothetical protein
MVTAMRRLVVLALASGLAAIAAGCGMGGATSGDPGAPESRELAWQSFRAAQAAGSVHYAFEATLASDATGPIRLAFEGDVDRGGAQADISLSGNGQSLAGTLLYDRAGFFVRYLDRWYGRELPSGQAQELRRELDSEQGFSGRFEDIFEGSVSTGPVVDGVSTWAYNGRLDADGLAELAEEEGQTLGGDESEQLEKLAESARFTLLVGQSDMLPRAFRLDLQGEGADLAGIAGVDPGALSVTLSGSFSRWGEPVRITPPSSYAPLEELFRQFFSF